MRFRISTSGNLQPTGRVVGGDVEDYAVAITQLPTPQTPVISKPADFNLTDGSNRHFVYGNTSINTWPVHRLGQLMFVPKSIRRKRAEPPSVDLPTGHAR